MTSLDDETVKRFRKLDLSELDTLRIERQGHRKYVHQLRRQLGPRFVVRSFYSADHVIVEVRRIDVSGH